MNTRFATLLALSAFATTALTEEARADLVSVQGTARVDFVDAALLAKIGAAASVGDIVEFEFTFESHFTDGQYHPGSFVTAGLSDVANNPLTISLVPWPVVWHAWNDIGNVGALFDHFASTMRDLRNGWMYSMGVTLSDYDATNMPGDPASYLDDLASWEFAEFGMGVQSDPDPTVALSYGLYGEILTLSATSIPTPIDADGDGVTDSQDQCAGSGAGVTNADGCTVEQLVPCAGPAGGGTWRNHGKYVAALAKIANDFFNAGLITEEEKDAIIAGGAQSSCP